MFDLYSYQYSKLQMEHDPQLIVDQSNQTRANPISQEYNESYQSPNQFDAVIMILSALVEVLKNKPKIQHYLQQIGITSEELSNGYKRIIDQFNVVRKNSENNPIIKKSMENCWTFIADFLRTKNLTALDTKGITVWLLEIQTKIVCTLDFLHAFKDYQDITNSPPANYTDVWDKINIYKPKDLKKLKKDVKDFKKMLHIATAAVINQSDHDFSLIKLASFGLSFPRYMVMSDSGKLQSFKFYRNPTLQIAQKIWNLPQGGATKEFLKITYKSIKTHKKIYIPPNGQINSSTDIFTENPDYITVRVLYNNKIDILSQGVTCCSSSKKQSRLIDTIILHMHGGGFVALSSRSMQNYTREWANQIDVPIFSIDYRMPPDHPFPQAPQDCLIVYRFLIDHIDKFMNIKPINIYLAGDSAGGNLACSLTGLILKNKLPTPRGLYLAYPATDLRMTFSPSKINALTDILLWPSMLLVCLKSYLSNKLEQVQDPLASPILLNEEYVNGTVGDKRFPLKWPRTIVTCGTKDPLLDDTLTLMEKMVRSKVDCECFLYEDLSHGYLSTALIIQQTAKTITQSIEHLKKLMEPKQERKTL